jgi:hypothetical protein
MAVTRKVMTPHEVDVFVFRSLNSNPPAKVDPSPLEVRYGDTIQINAPGTDLQVLFPNHYAPRPLPFRIVSPDPCPWILWATPNEVLFNIPAGQSVTVEVLDSAAIGDRYPFAVYCKSRNVFAEGNSDPEIIIRNGD